MCHWLIKKRHKLPYYLITLGCECSRDPLLTFMAAPLSIQMYRNIQLKSAHHAVTSEQLNYHSKVSEEELHKFLKRGPIDPQKVGEEFDTYADAALAVVAFRSLFYCYFARKYNVYTFNALFLACSTTWSPKKRARRNRSCLFICWRTCLASRREYTSIRHAAYQHVALQFTSCFVSSVLQSTVL